MITILIYLHIKFKISSCDPMFNFSRPLTFDHLNKKINVVVTPNNATFPWTTDHHSNGFVSHLGLRSLYDDINSGVKQTYHESLVYEGSSYRFHSPFELPFHKTSEYTSDVTVKIQFFVTPKISYLGESLLNYGVERCCLNFCFQDN